MKFELICYWRINMKFGLIYCWWINLKFVNLGLWLYCIWWLSWDIWIISIAYCLFGIESIVNWLFVWVLLDWAWDIISFDYVYYWCGLVNWYEFWAHNVGEICWMTWIFDMDLANLNYLIWTWDNCGVY